VDAAGKSTVRILVSTGGAMRWPTWAYVHHIPTRLRRDLDQAARRRTERTWVVDTPLPREAWIRIERLGEHENVIVH
jgi:hypothetical protein